SLGPAPAEIYTLSLHDALPIFGDGPRGDGIVRVALAEDLGVVLEVGPERVGPHRFDRDGAGFRIPGVGPHQLGESRRQPCLLFGDRKSTRLNSSHVKISYAVFC